MRTDDPIEDLKTRLDRQWRDQLKSLKPNYRMMYLNMLSGIVYIFVGIAFFHFLAPVLSTSMDILMVFLMNFYFAFFLQKYTAHFHEASHFNLHPSKQINDMLAAILLTPLIGLPIKAYRKVHWQHHKHLGTDQDSEISYVNDLTLYALFKLISGIYIWETLLRYFNNLKSKKTIANGTRKNPALTDNFLFALLIFGLSNLTIIIAMALFINTWCAASWALSIILGNPTFACLRQTLEHRTVNYSDKNRATNRNFGTGWLAKTFGSAGFNRHLLHHWSPATHYTLFDEYEKFILASPLKDEYIGASTTYWRTFLSLIR